MARNSTDVVQGTLEMMILKTLELEPMHGYGLTLRIQQVTRDVFRVNPGSLFSALRRLEREGWVKPVWRKTENNRRAKYYSLTRTGKQQLKSETRDWQRRTAAIARLLEAY